jgi:hypothetical protein
VVIAFGRGEAVELPELFGGQRDGVGGHVLLDPAHALGARNRRDVVALGQQPRDGHLGRRGSHLSRNLLHLVGDP